MVTSMQVSKLDLNAGVRPELLVNTAKKTIAHTNAQMVKNVVVNTPTRSINLLSPRMNSVELTLYSRWSTSLVTAKTSSHMLKLL